MFTGIVEACSGVVGWKEGRLVVESPADWVAEPPQIGDSIAVNGCCLTVVDTIGGLGFDLSPETIARTTFEWTKPGDRVNLERPVRVDARLGGHIVQGHVDGRGEVLGIKPLAESYEVAFRVPEGGRRYLIDKGSISVDGVSLTVCEPDEDTFSVWIIPHTFAVTKFGLYQPGDRVNLEYDMLAKHVEKLMAFYRPL